MSDIANRDVMRKMHFWNTEVCESNLDARNKITNCENGQDRAPLKFSGMMKISKLEYPAHFP